LQPTLYGRTPKPDVERRFRDQDPAGRLAATLIERCLAYSVDACNFDALMRAVVEDRLLPGRGVAGVVYVPQFGEPLGPDQGSNVTGQDRQEQPGDDSLSADDLIADERAPDGPAPEAWREVVFEEARAHYVFWEDYREGP